MAELGVGATRVEDVTARADVAKGVFYNYFESKEELVAELVQEGVAELFANFLLPFPQDPDTVQRVRHASSAHRRFFNEHPEHLLLFHQARGLLKTRMGRSEKLANVFRTYLEHLAAGLFPKIESPAGTLHLAAVIGGAVAGYTSFLIAAGLSGAEENVDEILALGMERFFEKQG